MPHDGIDFGILGTNVSEHVQHINHHSTIADENIGQLLLRTRLLYLIIAIIGAFGNIASALVIASSRSMRSIHTNLLILNQCAIDCSACIVVLVMMSTYGAKGQHEDSPEIRSTVRCLLWDSDLPFWTLITCSTYNLVFVSIERYSVLTSGVSGVLLKAKSVSSTIGSGSFCRVAPMTPMTPSTSPVASVTISVKIAYGHISIKSLSRSLTDYIYTPPSSVRVQKYLVTRNGVFSLIVCSWVIGPLIQIGLLLPTTRVVNGVCVDWDVFTYSWQRRVYGCAEFTTTFLVPGVTFVVCYGSIYRLLYTCRPNSNANPAFVRNSRSRRDVIKTLLAVVLCYFACNAVRSCCYLAYNLGEKTIFPVLFWQLATIATFANCSVNPILYTLQYRAYQQQLHRLLANCGLTTERALLVLCSRTIVQ